MIGAVLSIGKWVNTLRSRKNGAVFKLIFLYQNYHILIQMPLKLIRKGSIANKSVLVLV